MLTKFGIVIIAIGLQIQLGSCRKSKHNKGRYEPVIPDSCKGQSYCEGVPNYPEEHANKLIASLDRSKFNPRYEYPPNEMYPQMRNGFVQEDEYPKEVPLCDYTEKVITPDAARTANNTWVFLLNRRSEPVQNFQVEICEYENLPCNSWATIKSGFAANCKQMYIEKVAIVIDRNGEAVNENIRVPSNCNCKVMQC